MPASFNHLITLQFNYLLRLFICKELEVVASIYLYEVHINTRYDFQFLATVL